MPAPLSILILAEDPMVAALLGLLAELAGWAPSFAAVGERNEDALERVRPVSVVLLDGETADARSDLFFARAARLRVGVALVAGPAGEPVVAAAAARRGLAFLPLPADRAAFERAVQAASAGSWWRGRGERRRPRELAGDGARVEPAVGGGVFFVEATGRRWFVYDRRGDDRRRAPRDGADERLFVSEAGEVLHYALAEAEGEARSAGDLARQLALASPMG